MAQNLLMTCVNMYPGHAYLPYQWALFKTETERDPFLRESFHWLDPIYLAPPKMEKVRQTYDLASVDVVLLSLYEWNTWFSMDVAKAVKEANPNALVIAGGPDVRWRDDEWYLKWPMVDVSIMGDGERALRAILTERAKGGNDFGSIPGLMLPGPDGRTIRTSEKPIQEIMKDDKLSPYLEQNDHLVAMLADMRTHLDNKHMWAVLETNRGCPYTCTFCDWSTGSTGSKVRRVDQDRIFKEIDWIGQNEIPNIYLADGNFGILPRDVDITRHIIATKEKYGYPNLIFFNPAKNNTDRIVEIIDMLYAAGMMKFSLNLNFQSTNPEVLRIMRRENISDLDVQLDLVNKFRARSIPVGCSLILGCPGETKETWFETTTNMLEYGFHNEVRVFNWLLLPNSPAADPAYIERYDIKYVSRTTQFNHLAKAHVSPYLGRSQFLVGSFSYTSDDWMEMTIYTALFAAGHILGLTKHAAMYMREFKDVPYKDFYRGLYLAWKEAFPDIYGRMRAHFENFLVDETALYNINLMDEMPILVETEEFIFLRTIMAKDDFYAFLRTYLETLTPGNHELDELVTYQKEIIIDLDYHPQKGKVIGLHKNWFEIFNLIQKNDEAYRSLYRQNKLVKMYMNQNATGTYGEVELDFYKQKKLGRKLRKYTETVLGHRNARANRTYFEPDDIRYVNTLEDIDDADY